METCETCCWHDDRARCNNRNSPNYRRLMAIDDGCANWRVAGAGTQDLRDEMPDAEEGDF